MDRFPPVQVLSWFSQRLIAMVFHDGLQVFLQALKQHNLFEQILPQSGVFMNCSHIKVNPSSTRTVAKSWRSSNLVLKRTQTYLLQHLQVYPKESSVPPMWTFLLVGQSQNTSTHSYPKTDAQAILTVLFQCGGTLSLLQTASRSHSSFSYRVQRLTGKSKVFPFSSR